MNLAADYTSDTRQRGICGALHKSEDAAPDCNVATAAAILKVMANDDRMGVLLFLADRGEMRFEDVRQRFGFSQPKMSQVLSRLRREKFVAVRRDGHAAFYRLGSREARVLVERLFSLFARPRIRHNS